MSVILFFDVPSSAVFDGPVGAFEDRFPDATEHAVVLTAVKDGLEAVRKWRVFGAGHP